MIFDHKNLSEILDEEIELLVLSNVLENKNLEYKLTINYKTDQERFEVLCDMVSLVNAGGGYLIIGIRDDGKGKAQRFESVDKPEQIIKSIQALCNDHIAERIDGIEYSVRDIQGSKIIVFRVPESYRIPHMVTYKNHTHFSTRYNDGKREMSIGEIRSAFTNDLFGMKLTHIEGSIKNIVKNQGAKSDKELISMIENDEVSEFAIDKGEAVAKAYTNKFIKNIGEKPYFRISIIPKETNQNFLHFSADIKKVFDYHPEDRNSGWNMTSRYTTTSVIPNGLLKKETENEMLMLKQNGYMEFYTEIDEGFCWTQPVAEYQKRPRLYPYAIIEYTYSFLRLYKTIIKTAKIEDAEFIITAGYYNIKGVTLNPYHPNSLAYSIQHNHTQPFKGDYLVIPTIELKTKDFNVDDETYKIVKYVYESFGYDETKIPLVKKTNDHAKFLIV